MMRISPARLLHVRGVRAPLLKRLVLHIPASSVSTHTADAARAARRVTLVTATLAVAGVFGTIATVEYILSPRTIVAPYSVHVISTMPLRAVSRLFGWVNAIDLPVPLRPVILGMYARVFGADVTEARETDLKAYRNLQEFFFRELRDGARPIDTDASLVSPADGRVLSFGEISGNRVEQVKGATYDLDLFLGPALEQPGEPVLAKNDQASSLAEFEAADPNVETVVPETPETGSIRKRVGANNVLYYCVIYLAPGDYHRFHSPAHWLARTRRHFPGDLFSVSPTMAGKLHDLFVLNERVVVLGEWQHGMFAMAPVGATNVGSIQLHFDPTLKTNIKARMRNIPIGSYAELGYHHKVKVPANYAPSSHQKALYHHKYVRNPWGVELAAGQEMGGFRLGSTVVLIFEAPRSWRWRITPGQRLKVGQALG